jgi:hypothetical protein
MKKTLLLALFSALSLHLTAQSAGDFRTRQSGNWNNSDTWEEYTGGSWQNSANVPDQSDGLITIGTSHNVTIPSGYTASVDQVVLSSSANSFITISSGGVLDLKDGAGSDLTLGSSGTNRGRVEVFGEIVINEGATIANGTGAGRIVVASGGKYVHAYVTSPGTIYAATWQSGSILEFTGYTSITEAPANFVGGIFKNVIWNCADQEDDVTLDLTGTVTIDEDFIVRSTNPDSQWFLMLGESSDFTLDIGGNLVVEDDAILYVSGYNSIGISPVVNIGGDFLYQCGTSGSVTTLSAGSGDDVVVNIEGRLEIDAPGNGLAFCEAAGGVATINVKGDVEVLNGVLQTAASTTADLVFTGTSQSFSCGISLSPSAINFKVSDNTILAIPASSFISGPGTFTLGTTLGATLVVGSTNGSGAIQTGTANGNIRVSGGRTYAAGSRIVYNGAAAQVIGNGFPTGGDVNLEIDNAAGVSMNGNLTFNTGRQLILTSGALTVGTNTLTVDGNLSGSGALSTVQGSSLSFGGAGTAISLNFVDTEGEVGNFTLNRNTDAPVVLADSMRIYGTFTNTKGVLDISGRSLQISGAYSAGAGSLKTNTSSSLRVNTGGASSAFTGNLNFTSGSLLGLLRINRLGATIPTTSNVAVNRLELISGTLGNTSSLEIASNGRILRDAGSMNTIPGGSNPYSVEYIASTGISTGNELPNASDSLRLQTLCVNGSGTITLVKSIVINDSAVFKGGQFDADDKIVFMFGPNWTYAGGTFISNSNVTFARTTTIGGTGTIQFTNVRIPATGNVTLPSGTMSVSGTYQAFVGATVNPNNGTLLLNGSGNQQIFGGNTSLNNITVDKTGGNVSLENPLQLLGTLDFETGTTFDAGPGRLTLRSTDDDPAADARIAALTGGAAVTGSIVVQRYMSGEGRIYRYLSVPVSGATVASWQDDFTITGVFDGADPSSLNNPSLFWYNEPLPGSLDDSWEAYPDPDTGSSTDPLNVGRGYAAFIRAAGTPTIVDVSGTINSGDINLPIDYTSNGSAADGWNLVGNPYPSAIDWQEAGGWVKTNLDDAIYVRDNGAGGVYASFVNGVGNNGGNGRIAIGQAFWVKAGGAGAALTVKEAAKTGNVHTFFRVAELENLLRFYVNNDTLQDEGVIYFFDKATDDFDGKYDALKLPNEGFNVFSWSDDNKKIAINAFKKEQYIQKEVKIGLSNIKNGTYQFDITKLSTFAGLFNFILTDRYTNTTLEFTNEVDSIGFQFTVTDEELSRAEDRFRLNITQIITGLEDEADDLIRLYPNPGSKFVFLAPGQEQILEGYLIDNRGAVVKKLEFGRRDENGTFSLDIGDLKNGLYLLRLHTDSGNVVIKKLLVQ